MRRPRAPSNSAAPAAGASQRGRPASSQPAERPVGRHAVRHGALLAALAEHPHHPAAPVDVVDVEPAQLADPDPGGVEQLEHRHVAQAERAAVVGAHRSRVQQRARLGGVSAGGSVVCAFGEPRRRPGRSARGRSASAQAVKTRTAVARRAIVERALPSVCWLANQLRSVRRSSVVRSVWPRAAAWVSSPATSPR